MSKLMPIVALSVSLMLLSIAHANDIYKRCVENDVFSGPKFTDADAEVGSRTCTGDLRNCNTAASACGAMPLPKVCLNNNYTHKETRSTQTGFCQPSPSGTCKICKDNPFPRETVCSATYVYTQGLVGNCQNPCLNHDSYDKADGKRCTP